MQRTMAAGIVLIVVGAILAMGFWPAASTSGAELLASRSGSGFTGYAVGDRILVRDRVVDVQYANFFGNPLTQIELEDGDPNTATYVYVRGDARPNAAIGSYVYMNVVLQSLPFDVAQYWEVATPSDVQPSFPIDAVFYSVAGIGILLVVVGALRPARQRETPQKQA